MILKSLYSMILIGAILTPSQSFASSDVIEFSIWNPGTWCGVWTEQEFQELESEVKNDAQIALNILEDAAKNGGVAVLTDVVSGNYARAGIDAMTALSFALHHYKANGNNAQMALAALSGVASTVATNLEQNSGKTLTLSAGALVTGIMTSVVANNPSVTPEVQLLNVFLSLKQAILDDFRDDGKINLSDSVEYKQAFDQVFAEIPSLMPSVNPTIILNLQLAFDHLFAGKGDRAALIESAKIALDAFHVANPTTPDEIEQNTIAKFAETVIDGVSGNGNVAQDLQDLIRPGISVTDTNYRSATTPSIPGVNSRKMKQSTLGGIK